MGHLKLMILTSAVSLSWQYLSSDVGNFIKLTFILRQIYRVSLSQVFPTCPPTRNPLQAPDCGVGEDGGCCDSDQHYGGGGMVDREDCGWEGGDPSPDLRGEDGEYRHLLAPGEQGAGERS